MIDFLKATPAFSMQDVMWNLSVPFVKIMMADATQVHYLTEEQQKRYKEMKRNKGNAVYEDPYAFAKALNIPIFE